MREEAFRIHGMDCAEEVEVLKRSLGPLVGGEDPLTFDLLQGKVTVHGTEEVSVEDILRAVARTGMRAEVWQDGTPDQQQGSLWQQHSRTITMIASGLLAVAGFSAHAVMVGGVRAALGEAETEAGHAVPWLASVLYALGILSGVWFVVPKAWYAARTVRPECVPDVRALGVARVFRLNLGRASKELWNQVGKGGALHQTTGSSQKPTSFASVSPPLPRSHGRLGLISDGSQKPGNLRQRCGTD